MKEGATHHPSFCLFPSALELNTFNRLLLAFKRENRDFHTSVTAIGFYYLGNFAFGLTNRYDLMKQNNTTVLLAYRFLRKAWIG